MMPTLALEITASAGDGWINAVARTRYPYGPADKFDDIPLSTETMPTAAFVIYREMPTGSAVAAYSGRQWFKWLKA